MNNESVPYQFIYFKSGIFISDSFTIIFITVVYITDQRTDKTPQHMTSVLILNTDKYRLCIFLKS